MSKTQIICDNGLLEETLTVLPLGKLSQDHGYSYEWTSGQKPQLIKDGRRIKCSTENNVPTVVSGSSTIDKLFTLGNTFISNIKIARSNGSYLYPASTRSESTRARRMNEQKSTKKMETTRPYGETCCFICPNCNKLWMKVFQNTGTHPRILLVNQLQNRQQKWYKANTILKLISRSRNEDQMNNRLLPKTRWCSRTFKKSLVT